MISPEQLPDVFAEKVARIFGADDDPMVLVERRALGLLAEQRPIVWEGDAQTFHFSFVGGAAEEVLGYPASKWTEEPTFWADVVVHPEDRDDAIAFCALATGRGADHDFQYRAMRPDGGIVLLHDIVKVIKSRRGLAERLRGIMIEVPEVPQNG
jgi:PAS domain-containing protein